MQTQVATSTASAADQFSSWAANGGSGLGHYLLEHVFGSQVLNHWGVSGGHVDGGPVTAAMGIVVTLALALVPLVLLYVYGVGLLHTAEHGEIGGKAWSGTWAPIRTMFGAATVIPVTPGGLSSIQLLVVGVALAGNYFGNTAAQTITIASYQHGKSALAPSLPTNPSPEAVTKSFTALTAMQACAGSAEEMGFSWEDNARVCKFAHVPAAGSAQAMTGLKGDENSTTGSSVCEGAQHKKVCVAIQNVNADFYSRANSLVNSEDYDANADKLKREYSAAIKKAIETNIAGEQRSQTATMSLDTLGWPAMGLWFVRLSSAQADFDNYITASSTKFRLEDIPRQSDPGYNVFVAASRATDSGERGILSGANELVKGFGRWVSSGEKSLFDSITSGNPPFEQLMDMGHWAMATGAAVMAGGSFLPKIGEAAKSTGVALIVLGLFMSVVLPAIPAIYVGYMAIEWVIWVAIASIASPLWTLLHMVPEGEGLIHHGAERGWKMLAFLLLFPVLVMVGYAVGIMVFNVAVPMMAQIVWGLVPNGSISALVDLLAKPVIVGVTMTITAFTCLGLIQRLPYQIADFLGINAGSIFTQEAAGHDLKPAAAIVGVEKILQSRGPATASAPRPTMKK